MVKYDQLKNGITVAVEEMPYMETISMALYVRCGSAYENSGNNGISHMIEHMLFKGTTNRSSFELADEITIMGDEINAFTAKEMTCYYGKVLPEDFLHMADVFADMILNSVFDERELEKEKKIILEENKMYTDSPEDAVQEKAQQISWKNHPLGYIISGPDENVQRFTRKEIVDWKNRFYVAENIVISVAGKCKEKEIISVLEKKFSGISRGISSLQLLTKPVFHADQCILNRDVEQAHLCISLPGHENDILKNMRNVIANNYFGEASNALLVRKIREEFGLVYAIYSFETSLTHAGTIQIYSAMDYRNISAVYDMILQCIDDFQNNGIPKEKVDQIKMQIRREELMNFEHTQSRCFYNARSILNDSQKIAFSDKLKLLENITADEVNQYIKEYYQTICHTDVFAGNIYKIKDEMER